MSQPVTNSDAEDVLALIRRLVLDEVQPRTGGHGLKDEGRTVPGSPVQDRLVLTPALRVVEPRGAQGGAAGGAARRDGAGSVRPLAEEAPLFRSRQAAPLRLERRVAPESGPAFRHVAAAETAAAAGRGAGPAAAGGAEDAALRALAGRMSVDEAALRQIVAQVIHQELRGALGERITHNLRKLVRREVARALSETGKA